MLVTSALAMAIGVGVRASAFAEPTRPLVAVASRSCTTTFSGEDSGRLASPQNALTVPDAPVAFVQSAPAPMHAFDTAVEVAGIRVTLQHWNGPAGTTFQNLIQVQEHHLGVGLFKLVARSFGPPPCTGVAFVKVEGRPIETLAGKAGWVLLLAGLGLLGTSLVVRRRERRVMRNEGWSGERGRWLRFSPLGIVGGLVLAGGILILLQEYAVVYPTIVVTALAAAAGVVVGIVLPSTSRAIYLRRLA